MFLWYFHHKILLIKIQFHPWHKIIDLPLKTVKFYFPQFAKVRDVTFCLVYHQFWELLCLFWSCRWWSSRKIKERAKWSNWESKKQIMGRAKEHAATWFYHAWLCTNVILLIVRVGIQSLKFFTKLYALFSLSLLIRFYSWLIKIVVLICEGISELDVLRNLTNK